MKIEKCIHKGYKAFEHQNDIPQIFGKYRYIYKTDEAIISLIQLKDYYKKGEDIWEIMCTKGGLFEDTEKFDTKGKAQFRIERLLYKPRPTNS